jgi:hypothetical protein
MAMKKTTSNKGSAKGLAGNSKRRLSSRAEAGVKKAAEVLWSVDESPHTLLKELHDVLLLRCLKEASGNYAAAASHFGPSRQSVQQYANSPLRDARWKSYQQSSRKRS